MKTFYFYLNDEANCYDELSIIKAPDENKLNKN